MNEMTDIIVVDFLLDPGHILLFTSVNSTKFLTALAEQLRSGLPQ